MSSEAPTPAAVAAPLSAESTTSIAASAPTSQFGSSILTGKDASEAIVEPSAEPQATVDSSEEDAAAIAAAAAAADASSAAQTITELATAATNAANSGPLDASSTSVQPSEEAIAEASDAPQVPGTEGLSVQADPLAQEQPQGEAAAVTEELASGLPRNIESELRDIYTVSSAIANFSVAHVNQVSVPTPQKVRTIIQKALKLTSSLSMLLAQPEIALRQLDADEQGKRPAESKLDSARKRQRSSDWNGDVKGASGSPGLPMTPSGLRVFPDGSLPTSFPSPGFGEDGKGPQYKKRSRAPAPGSCQACGTGETPEWRRGPDGARTLCNACGLHYAKLVRKRMQQEGVEESPSQAPPQASLVSLEELRASTKSAEAAAAAGLTPSGSSSSLNGTPIKGGRGGWNDTPSKPPRVPSGLGSSSVVADGSEEKIGSAVNEVAAAPPTEGIVEPAPTPAETAPEPVIAPELVGESGGVTITGNGDERPMETDQ